MTPLSNGMPADPIPSTLPVLRSVITPAELSDGVSAQLEARMRARENFMALGPPLVAALRPELERLMADLVQRSLQEAWREHCLAENWGEKTLGSKAP